MIANILAIIFLLKLSSKTHLNAPNSFILWNCLNSLSHDFLANQNSFRLKISIHQSSPFLTNEKLFFPLYKPVRFTYSSFWRIFPEECWMKRFWEHESFSSNHLRILYHQTSIHIALYVTLLLQCFRYTNVLDRARRSSWTREEDLQLLRLVEEIGEGNWTIIASHMKDRVDCQCLRRWNALKLCVIWLFCFC